MSSICAVWGVWGGGGGGRGGGVAHLLVEFPRPAFHVILKSMQAPLSHVLPLSLQLTTLFVLLCPSFLLLQLLHELLFKWIQVRYAGILLQSYTAAPGLLWIRI